MVAQLFHQWVEAGIEENADIYDLPDTKESEVLSVLYYISETPYFYRGSDSWGLEDWDEHMEYYFMDMRYTRQEMPRRRVYHLLRKKYLAYQTGIKQPLKPGISMPVIARPRRAIPLGIRWQVLERDHRRCVACGASPKTDLSVRLQIDHIVPVSRGGSNTVENLQTLCANCNLGKSDRMPA